MRNVWLPAIRGYWEDALQTHVNERRSVIWDEVWYYVHPSGCDCWIWLDRLLLLWWITWKLRNAKLWNEWGKRDCRRGLVHHESNLKVSEFRSSSEVSFYLTDCSSETAMDSGLALDDYQRYGRQMILDGFGLPGWSSIFVDRIRLPPSAKVNSSYNSRRSSLSVLAD
jgi:hypothetical protein